MTNKAKCRGLHACMGEWPDGGWRARCRHHGPFHLVHPASLRRDSRCFIAGSKVRTRTLGFRTNFHIQGRLTLPLSLITLNLPRSVLEGADRPCTPSNRPWAPPCTTPNTSGSLSSAAPPTPQKTSKSAISGLQRTERRNQWPRSSGNGVVCKERCAAGLWRTPATH